MPTKSLTVYEKFRAAAELYTPAKTPGDGWSAISGPRRGGQAIIQVQQSAGDSKATVTVVRFQLRHGKDVLNARIMHGLPIVCVYGNDKEVRFKCLSTTTSNYRQKTVFAIRFEDAVDTKNFVNLWYASNGSTSSSMEDKKERNAPSSSKKSKTADSTGRIKTNPSPTRKASVNTRDASRPMPSETNIAISIWDEEEEDERQADIKSKKPEIIDVGDSAPLKKKRMVASISHEENQNEADNKAASSSKRTSSKEIIDASQPPEPPAKKLKVLFSEEENHNEAGNKFDASLKRKASEETIDASDPAPQVKKLKVLFSEEEKEQEPDKGQKPEKALSVNTDTIVGHIKNAKICCKNTGIPLYDSKRDMKLVDAPTNGTGWNSKLCSRYNETDEKRVDNDKGQVDTEKVDCNEEKDDLEAVAHSDPDSDSDPDGDGNSDCDSDPDDDKEEVEIDFGDVPQSQNWQSAFDW